MLGRCVGRTRVFEAPADPLDTLHRRRNKHGGMRLRPLQRLKVGQGLTN